jgi:hypothetical protein
MRHHAHNVWIWNYDEKSEETGRIYVEQDKARNGKRFPFPLMANFDIMRLGDAEEEEDDKRGKARNKKSKRRKRQRERVMEAIEEELTDEDA